MENFPFAFELGEKPPLKLSKQFNSTEKQFVRNKLWLPFYKKVCGGVTPVGKIKYLCFPGLGCNFIKQLSALGLISKDQTTIVAIEQNKFWHKSILEYFASIFTLGKYEVIEGTYEKMISEERLLRWFMEKPFGFDIIELDFPASLFSLSADRRFILLESIAKTLKLQTFYGRNFYMLTTFKAQTPIPQSLNAQYGNSSKMLSKEILQKENALLNNAILNSLIATLASNPTEHSDEECNLFAIPLAIIRRAEGICTIELEEVPYTHVSESVGGTSRLASYVFKCQPRSYTIDCAGDYLSNEIKKRLDDAIKKTANAVWVNCKK